MKKWLARKREDQVNPKNLTLQNLLKNLRHQRTQKRKGNTTEKRKQNQGPCVKMIWRRLRCQLTACFPLQISLKLLRTETLRILRSLLQLQLILMKKSRRNPLSS